MARMLRGMSSRCCRMLKCHVFIRIMSSNMNSRYNRPSTHTWKQACHKSAHLPTHPKVYCSHFLMTLPLHTLLPPEHKFGCAQLTQTISSHTRQCSPYTHTHTAETLNRSLSSPHVASLLYVYLYVYYKLHEDRLVFTCVPL